MGWDCLKNEFYCYVLIPYCSAFEHLKDGREWAWFVMPKAIEHMYSTQKKKIKCRECDCCTSKECACMTQIYTIWNIAI